MEERNLSVEAKKARCKTSRSQCNGQICKVCSDVGYDMHKGSKFVLKNHKNVYRHQQQKCIMSMWCFESPKSVM